MAKLELTLPADAVERAVKDGIEAMLGGAQWLVWSNQRGMWWRPRRSGYTQHITEAGRYDRAEAEQIVKQATCDGALIHMRTDPITGRDYEEHDEVMVLAPADVDWGEATEPATESATESATEAVQRWHNRFASGCDTTTLGVEWGWGCCGRPANVEHPDGRCPADAERRSEATPQKDLQTPAITFTEHDRIAAQLARVDPYDTNKGGVTE